MQQNINLYRNLPKKSKYTITPLLMAQITALFFSLLIIATLYAWMVNLYYNYHASYLQKAQLEATRQLSEIVTRYPKNPQRIKIQNEIYGYQIEIETKKKIIQELSQESEPSRTGFSDFLVGLAKASVPEVWLKTISVLQTGRQVTLLGSTSQPGAVMNFVKNLSQQPSYSGKELKTFKLVSSEDTPGITDFVLSTENNVPLSSSPTGKK